MLRCGYGVNADIGFDPYISKRKEVREHNINFFQDMMIPCFPSKTSATVIRHNRRSKSVIYPLQLCKRMDLLKL